MPKVIAIAQVEDLSKWEEGFATHSELFKSQTVSSPIHYMTDKASDQVTICFEPSDLDTFLKIMDTPETAEAMKNDGVKRETVKFFVLNKKMEFQVS